MYVNYLVDNIFDNINNYYCCSIGTRREQVRDVPTSDPTAVAGRDDAAPLTVCGRVRRSRTDVSRPGHVVGPATAAAAPCPRRIPWCRRARHWRRHRRGEQPSCPGDRRPQRQAMAARRVRPRDVS